MNSNLFSFAFDVTKSMRSWRRKYRERTIQMTLLSWHWTRRRRAIWRCHCVRRILTLPPVEWRCFIGSQGNLRHCCKKSNKQKKTPKTVFLTAMSGLPRIKFVPNTHKLGGIPVSCGCRIGPVCLWGAAWGRLGLWGCGVSLYARASPFADWIRPSMQRTWNQTHQISRIE